jgi:hypothetical protein
MRRFLLPGAVAMFVLATLAPSSSVLARTSLAEDEANANAQIAQLYQLQTAFHSAASIHNPDGLDTEAALQQRLTDMLSLWADDGSLTLKTVSPGRVFTGKGDPTSDSCAVGSNTLCDFFRNVAPPFRPDKRLVALTPAFKTHLSVDGATAATMYFECHYFDASTWQDTMHLNFDGTAEKVDGRWLFAHADVSAVGVPYP